MNGTEQISSVPLLYYINILLRIYRDNMYIIPLFFFLISNLKFLY